MVVQALAETPGTAGTPAAAQIHPEGPLPSRLRSSARGCYSIWETLDRQGRSPGTVRENELVRELARAGLAEKTAEMCARLCRDVDWTAKTPLSAWLKAVRSFYLPKLQSV